MGRLVTAFLVLAAMRSLAFAAAGSARDLCDCPTLLWKPRESYMTDVATWHDKIMGELAAAESFGVIFSLSKLVPGG
jgi:hypothetical protein